MASLLTFGVHWKARLPRAQESQLAFHAREQHVPSPAIPEETSPKSTLKAWTQIAPTAYYFQASLMILQA